MKTNSLDEAILRILPTDRDLDAWMPTPRVIQLLNDRGHHVDYPRQVRRRLVAMERDLLVLSCASGRQRLWQRKSWLRGANQIASLMSASEAVAFHALRRFVGARLPAAVTMDIEPLFKAADTRLAQDREDSRHYRAWSNKIGSVESTYQLIRPPIDPAIFHTVTTAAFFERELLVKYHPAYRPATAEDDLPKRIWPLALVESSGLMYLIVQLPERSPNSKQGRANPLRVLYRVDRILSAVDTGHVFAYPRDFRLKDMIEEDKTLDFQPEPPVVLELAVDRQNAKRLRESHMSKDQKFDPESLPDGRFKVTGTVVPSVKLRWWLRSLGAGVEVLAPPSLREEFAREAAALAKRYGM